MSRAETVYSALRDEILSCRLAPGAAIDAAETATRYGVSKTPVRDALQRLALDELVEILPRKGYRVRNVTFRALSDIFDLRLALGPHAARNAAARATPEDIAALRRLVSGDDEAADGAVRRKASAFHIAVAELSGNQRLATLNAQLFDELERIIRLTVDFGGRAKANDDEFEEIIAALAAGDGDKAAAIEAAHIIEARGFLFRHLIARGFLSNAEISGEDGSPA
ncbi:MAG: hypothetical protein ABS35_27125 [Kaistia sp. SCN 65-12]|nr:MAG: hypothetical protein ABS35_27125 [Kaistia sp. SCN 65-12]